MWCVTHEAPRDPPEFGPFEADRARIPDHPESAAAMPPAPSQDSASGTPGQPLPRPPQPPVTPATAVAGALRKSFQSGGRASRSEFWLFSLFYSIVAWIPLAVGNNLDSAWLLIYGAIAYLGLLIPFVAVGIRRLHDTGRSGAWLLLLPTCLFFVLVVLWTEPGQPHLNRFDS